MLRSIFYLSTCITCISLTFLLFSCGNTNAEKALTEGQIFPKLLDRAAPLRNGKEWDDVQNHYGTQTEAIRQNPKNHAAKIKLAQVFMQEARVTGEHPHYYPAALEMLESAIYSLSASKKLDAKQTDLLFQALSNKASVQLSLHDFQAALETANQAVRINPHNAYIYGCLVDAHVELGNYKKAVEMCDKMVSIRPDLRSYARVSYLREIHGDLTGAIEAMKMAVEAGYAGYEQTEWARLQLGGLYEKNDALEKAKQCYTSALQYRENYPFALAALADIEYQMGNKKKAMQHIETACDIIPEVGFFEQKAKYLIAEGKTAKAEKLYAAIETMFEEDMAAGHNMSLELGRFHADVKGDYEKALRFIESEYTRRPNNIDVNKEMAYIYSKIGDTAKAKNYQAKSTVPVQG